MEGLGGTFFLGNSRAGVPGRRRPKLPKESPDFFSRTESEPTKEEPPSVQLRIRDLDPLLPPTTARRSHPLECVGFINQADSGRGNLLMMAAYECAAAETRMLNRLVAPGLPNHNHDFILSWNKKERWQSVCIMYFIDVLADLKEGGLKAPELTVVASYGSRPDASHPALDRKQRYDLHQILYGTALELAHQKGVEGRLYELYGQGCESMILLGGYRWEQFYAKRTPGF